MLDHLVVRFAGDSGDGMQLTGDRFTSVSASFGNDLSTMPDFPAEIRAPAGTVNGVSSFQVNIADHDITTPGDEPNVLVAMNPAALMADLHRLEPGGTVIVNEDAFDERNLAKVGYTTNPLDDGSLANYRVLRVPMTSLTKEVCITARCEAARRRTVEELLRARPRVVDVHPTDRRDARVDRPRVRQERTGRRPPTGRRSSPASTSARPPRPSATATRSGRPNCPPASTRASPATPRWRGASSPPASSPQLPVTLGSYPITPASDILHELSKHKHFGIRTVQAEDEIAAIGMALGAAFAGHLGVTTTSGPGVALKSETISLAISIELPLLIVDIQRGGPSTGPADQDRGVRPQPRAVRPPRRGAAPVIAAYSPAHCFEAAIEAIRIALKYRTPVILLSDGYLANGSEPWKLPDDRVAARHLGAVRDRVQPRRRRRQSEFWPYLRDEVTLARPWAIPGTPGLMHRVGGLEKADGTGHIDYTPENHEQMVHLRAAKIAAHRRGHPTDGGQRRRRRRRARARLGLHVGGDRRRRPADAAAPARRSPRPTSSTSTRCRPTSATSCIATSEVIVPELNLGQLSQLIRGKYLVDAKALTKVQGLPFKSREIETAIDEALASIDTTVTGATS